MGDIPRTVVELVERFERNLQAYRSGRYKETQLRREFIDPLFAAFGWDVENKAGYAEAYKDVVHEDAIKVGGATKAPDYCFRIGGVRKFFVEAKKPSVDIRDEPTAAYQLRRYAWSAKLPLSILTDFEEFAVYDCRVRPRPADKPAVGRTMYFTYDRYADRWGDLAGIFGKEAVLKGSFDKYVVSSRKRGTAEVDAEFLKDIERWREALARNIALRNAGLGVREINFAVQRTLDRIIFLRMCEDRGVEAYGSLQGLLNGTGVYGRLMQLFQAADDRYNSGLFHFRAKDPAHGDHPPDGLTPALTLDDKVLKDIFAGLYYPVSPYEFSVLPADILGNVYEQFLGKVIHLTPTGRARVEEKPEVKKAGGVYYTPKYIVDYIVEQTVGKLLAGKSPRQAARLRILDPACGSGSFLVGAYKCLLAHHRDGYVSDGPARHRKQLYQGAGGQWYLTTEEKKRILLNNIYGVDIDPQAVEVTKLNLLLCVLEDENQATLRQLSLIHERALPDLSDNVKCGNSLIGSDFYEGQQLALFDDETRYRINAFDWPEEFPDIFQRKNPGFDAVIGNPPYVLLQDEFRDDRQLEYFRRCYPTARFKVDTYHLFVEKTAVLGRGKGLVSMIVPANLLTNNALASLRRHILRTGSVDHIVVVDKPVFRGTSVDSAIFVLRLGRAAKGSFCIIHAVPEMGHLNRATELHVSVDTALSREAVLFTGPGESARSELWDKVTAESVELGCIADVNFGKQLRDRTKFAEDVIQVKFARQIRAPYRPCYTGRDTSRYHLEWSGLACLDDVAAKRGGCWDSGKQNARNKLLTKQIGRYPQFALDEEGFQCLNTMFMVNVRVGGLDPRFLLGFLNSRLCKAIWTDKFYDQRRTFPKIKGTYLKKMPVYRLRSGRSGDRRAHDRMVDLAETMQQLHRQFAAAKIGHDKIALQRQIDMTDKQIDRLVYDLYGLTAEEVGIVEEATRG